MVERSVFKTFTDFCEIKIYKEDIKVQALKAL